jgi:uncharacterized membrane protein YjdF
MLASWFDWIPWQLGVAILVLMGIVLIAGMFSVWSWWYDVTIGGTMDDLRDMGQRFIEWRTRRRLRP